MALGHSELGSMVHRWDRAFAYLEEFHLLALEIQGKERLVERAFVEVLLRIAGIQDAACPLSLESMHQEVRQMALTSVVAVAALVDLTETVVGKSRRVSKSRHHRWRSWEHYQ